MNIEIPCNSHVILHELFNFPESISLFINRNLFKEKQTFKKFQEFVQKMIGIGQRQIRKSAAWTETTGKAFYREKAEAKQINYLNVYSLSIRLALLGKV